MGVDRTGRAKRAVEVPRATRATLVLRGRERRMVSRAGGVAGSVAITGAGAGSVDKTFSGASASTDGAVSTGICIVSVLAAITSRARVLSSARTSSVDRESLEHAARASDAASVIAVLRSAVFIRAYIRRGSRRSVHIWLEKVPRRKKRPPQVGTAALCYLLSASANCYLLPATYSSNRCSKDSS